MAVKIGKFGDTHGKHKSPNSQDRVVSNKVEIGRANVGNGWSTPMRVGKQFDVAESQEELQEKILNCKDGEELDGLLSENQALTQQLDGDQRERLSERQKEFEKIFEKSGVNRVLDSAQKEKNQFAADDLFNIVEEHLRDTEI